jgi:hypothetical protein
MEPTSEIAALNTRLEAELVIAQLDEAGIDAFIIVDNAGGTFPMMQMVTGGYKVMVLTAVADEATEVLAPADQSFDGDSTPTGPLDPIAGFSPTQLAALIAILLLVVIPVTAYAVRVWIF